MQPIRQVKKRILKFYATLATFVGSYLRFPIKPLALFANREYNISMKGQDILVMLKLVCRADRKWSYSVLARELDMSASEVHAAIKRCEEAGLYNRHSRQPNREALREFLLHGLRYVFPARHGPLVQGLPTSYAAPPLAHKIRSTDMEAPVMPLPQGPARGPEIAPIFHSAPKAASNDECLYSLLALVDALRTGKARERKMAEKALSTLLTP